MRRAFQWKVLVNLVAMLDKNTSSADCVTPFHNGAETPSVALSHVWLDGLCSGADIGCQHAKFCILKSLWHFVRRILLQNSA